MSLRDVEIKGEYRTYKDDVPHMFYEPLLSQASCYKRAVGFFSSSSLAAIAIGISALARRGGHIKVVASPKLSEADVKAIKEGYERRSSIIERALIRELRDTVAKDGDRLNLLANLIAANLLDIKIVTTKRAGAVGMYHEKLGIIEDDEGNVVAFSGSMNESMTGLCNNYEAFDVFCSWLPGEAERVKGKEAAFSAIWNNEEPGILVQDFPKVNAEIIRRYKTREIDFSEKYQIDVNEHEKISEEMRNSYEVNIPSGKIVKPASVDLYDYQESAIAKWLSHNGCGIFDMATGTGKTFTGLGAVAALCNKVDRLAVFIVCPYQHLVEQWAIDAKLFGADPIIAYSGSAQKNYKTRIRNAVIDFGLGVKNYICIICTNATFASESMQKEVKKIETDTLLLVDEAHNFGATNLRNTLKKNFQYRLALSATLERHYDEDGTEELKRFFGEKCIEYPLARAIKEGKLTPYEYRPILTILSEGELDIYVKLTREIAQCLIKKRNGMLELNEKGKRLALKRARLVAGAVDKIVKLRELMEEYRKDKYMLVYCGATRLLEQDSDDIVIDEDLRQIDCISRVLNFDLGMETAQFTSKENAYERKCRLEAFAEGNIQALVAIKCLDEGVNIPAIQTAFILASTTNPKEYVQRRGRVLRLSSGKEKALIYDFITLPRPLADVMVEAHNAAAHELGLVKRELIRMHDFIELAMKPFDAQRLYNDIIDAYELYDFDLKQNSDLWRK